MIDILVESGRGHGWGFSGTCAALLAHRAYYIHGTHPLTTDISDEYLALALEVQKLLKKGDEKADRIIASSISGTHPLIYIFQNTKNHWKEVEDITYDSLPFDYAVVFSGTPVQSLDATIQKKIFLKSEQSIISALDHAMADLGIKKNKAVSENDIYENYLSLIRQNNSLFLGALLSLTGEKDHA